LSYEILVATAYLVFVFQWFWNLRAQVLKSQAGFLVFFIIAIGGGIGAILGAWTLQSMAVMDFTQRGTALWGAFLGGYVFITIGYLVLSRRIQHLPAPRIFLNASVPGLGFAHAIGRMGCVLAGCCFGAPGHPVIAIEIGAGLIAGLVLQILWLSRSRRPRSLLLVYLVGYAILRFLLEFFRIDPGRGEFFALSTSQWVGLVVLLISGIFLDFGRRTRDKTAL